MKSQSDNLYHIVRGICKDIRAAYPAIKGLDLDLERLSLLVSSRGLGCFTLDLPAREALLIEGLETGLLRSEGTKKYSKRYPVPRLFAGLYMRIFDRDLRLRCDADVNAIAFLRQILCLGKKIEVPCSKKREFQAIKDYIHVEQHMVEPTLGWDLDYLDCHSLRNRVHFCDNLGLDLPLYPEYNIGRTAREQLLLQRCQHFADYLAEKLGTFCPDCFIETRRTEGRRLGLRHGPGAVAERGGRFFDKFRFSNWSAKLNALYPWETTGKMPLDERDKPPNHEVPARLICVPKTAKGPRIIAAEPSEHMFCQNLFADWLISRINDTELSRFIDFKDQSKSGRLVISASLDRKLATIDLSSASDRLSLYVVERVFRSNPSILKAIHASRTRWLRLPNGESIKLKKFASQGTALTFPVQTLVFWVIAMACCYDGIPSDEGLKRFREKVRVYGDDIIVPTTRYADVVLLLTALGLKVNTEKSFSNGNFRESCGVDAFKGYDITPIKPKTTTSDSPAAGQAVLDTINNLFCKGYWNASEQLENRQPSRTLDEFGLVGPDAGASGKVSYSFGTFLRTRLQFHVRIPSRSDSSSFRAGVDSDPSRNGWDFTAHSQALRREVEAVLKRRTRWNRALSRIEVRVSSIRAKSGVRPFDDGYSGLLQRQLLPSIPESVSSIGIEGVPERPAVGNYRRWEALDNFITSRS
nr:MAG: hypothetical protein 3 [Leviviridae sp.]